MSVDQLWEEFREQVILAGPVTPPPDTQELARRCFIAGIQALIAHLTPKVGELTRYELSEVLHDLNDEIQALIERELPRA
jgi:hypothetical protein